MGALCLSANVANPTEVRAVQSAVSHDEIYPGWALCHHRKGGGVWPQINTWILVTKWWLIANFIASGKNRSSQQAGGSGEGRKHAFIYRTKIFSFHGSLRNILFGAFGVQSYEIFSYQISSQTAPQQWIVSLSVFASVGGVESLSIRLVSREVRGEGEDGELTVTRWFQSNNTSQAWRINHFSPSTQPSTHRSICGVKKWFYIFVVNLEQFIPSGLNQ